MNFKFKNIAIIGRQHTTSAAKTLSLLVKHLQEKNINVFLEHDSTRILTNHKIPTISREKLKDTCDLIIVVGGDGSILSAARIAARQNLPMVGINRGDLGFLTDIAPQNIAKINEILDGKFYEEDRFLLTAKMEVQNKPIAENLALNDIVLLSYATGHMIEFSEIG
ncbi:MAG: NAD(+)/NADH kinase, partial [Gammaproteobacteria bacterium]|nr:NAD(+)/NADH kinase [Gammaproteobacteria bacterium]